MWVQIHDYKLEYLINNTQWTFILNFYMFLDDL
jgi:hypothetical protein